MTTNIEVSTTNRGLLGTLWHWFQAFDAALHDDEVVHLQVYLAQSKQKIAQLEAKQTPN